MAKSKTFAELQAERQSAVAEAQAIAEAEQRRIERAETARQRRLATELAAAESAYAAGVAANECKAADGALLLLAPPMRACRHDMSRETVRALVGKLRVAAAEKQRLTGRSLELEPALAMCQTLIADDESARCALACWSNWAAAIDANGLIAPNHYLIKALADGADVGTVLARVQELEARCFKVIAMGQRLAFGAAAQHWKIITNGATQARQDELRAELSRAEDTAKAAAYQAQFGDQLRAGELARVM